MATPARAVPGCRRRARPASGCGPSPRPSAVAGSWSPLAPSPAPNGADAPPVTASASGKMTSPATPSASSSSSRRAASQPPRRPSSFSRSHSSANASLRSPRSASSGLHRGAGGLRTRRTRRGTPGRASPGTARWAGRRGSRKRSPGSGTRAPPRAGRGLDVRRVRHASASSRRERGCCSSVRSSGGRIQKSPARTASTTRPATSRRGCTGSSCLRRASSASYCPRCVTGGVGAGPFPGERLRAGAPRIEEAGAQHVRPGEEHRRADRRAVLSELRVQRLGQGDDRRLRHRVLGRRRQGRRPRRCPTRCSPRGAGSPCSSMWGTNALMPWMTPHRLTSSAQRQSFSSCSQRRPSAPAPIPALLHRRCTGTGDGDGAVAQRRDGVPRRHVGLDALDVEAGVAQLGDGGVEHRGLDVGEDDASSLRGRNAHRVRVRGRCPRR